MKYCARVVANLERKILERNYVYKNVFEEIDWGITKSKKTLNRLKIRILEKGFQSPKEESLFFKTIKPIPLGYLIYFLNLADLETRRPQSSNKKIKKFLQDHLSLYQDYFTEHKSFYLYLERHRTDRDLDYFVRGQGTIKLHPDALPYCLDKEFSTSHDYIVAKIFAHKLLITRLNKELKTLEDPPISSESKWVSPLQWTGNKVDLIELIYGLHATGTINNGRIEIKEIATLFEHILNIDLGEYYRAYIEIRSRKINPTKFLDRMIQHLQLTMKQSDE